MKLLTAIFLCISFSYTHAQTPKPKVQFGNIKPEDFNTKVYSIDSSANAVVLFDYCDVKYEGNNQGFFSVIYTYHQRIHILNKNAFDVATIEIPLYKWVTLEERVEKLQAVTYSLENGKVVSSKLDKSSLFKEKVNKYMLKQKFTFPNLTEGCIIEVAYTVSSPTPREIRPKYFQGEYPILLSEYNVHIPNWYDFVRTKQGYVSFQEEKAEYTSEYYSLLVPGEEAMERSSVYSGNIPTLHCRYAMKDIPAFRVEPFTSSPRNHISKVTFQLSTVRINGGTPQRIDGNWFQISQDLLKREDFGADLEKSASWLDEEVKKVCATTDTELEKAKKIFNYVRTNFTCNDYDDYSMNQNLKKVFQAKKGNVSEINLVLVAMYKTAGLTAKPLLISTRENGKAPITYPILSKFNYTICQLMINNEKMYVDASHKKLGFGKLPAECYNDFGRVIDPEMPILVNFSPDSLLETKTTVVYIVNPEEGNGLIGSFKSNLGYYESLEMRELLEKKKQEDVFSDIKKSYGFEIDMSNTALDSLEVLEKPVELKYDFKFAFDEDVVYFSPMLTEALKSNPFKAAKRYYKVEMPYKTNETYFLNIEIPNGYAVDEIPKGARIKFNDTEGSFEYLIGKVGNAIQLRCTLKINTANFTPEDYATLRDFYAFIVQKESEQIVFKKIKK